MATLKNLIDTIDIGNAYNNPAEEVEIIKSAKTGNDYTLYTAINKNGITLHNIPGGPGVADTAFIGFVGTDRARPVILAPGAKTTTLAWSATPPWVDAADIL